MQGLSRAFI
ncbi:hypothetical protein CGLO_18346 [Colletotrichum gloeosporioides Cg-14]|uniref:Uncharacterized protein n=1 Tax=Colletotrichum gloeosporioides (strain Cg-14) TaxID=1237896 RepID=T0JUQ9_COLGC|nr:hypothetical protein CGLO_18346 [Colletotrichum gloeosporioides Cg-14]